MIQKTKTLILQQIRQGATPHGLALSCVIGCVFGCMPLYGLSTPLCIAAGLLLRLNHPVIQAANYLMLVPQLVLLPIFISVGRRMIGAQPLPGDPSVIFDEFVKEPKLFIEHFGTAVASGVLVWALVAPIAGFILYRVLLGIFTRAQKLRERNLDF